MGEGFPPIDWRAVKLAERPALRIRLPPIPSTLAGRREQIDAWLNYVDPETGEEMPLISKELATRLLAATNEP